MKCPRCGFLTNEKKCRKCGEYIYITNKMLNVSYRLYNEGLERAKLNDFSKAIKCLKKSLYFNKENIEVRNLLGLLYYNIGHFSDAIKHWIISTNIDETKDNKAFLYIDTFKKNARKFERLNKSIKLYNKAIRDIKTKNDDLAIIGLKKALSINKSFIDGLNLLSLCYIKQKKYKSASIYLEKVLSIDTKNEIATRYLDYIKAKNDKAKNPKKILKKDEENDNEILIIEERYNDKKGRLKEIYSFIVGVVLVSLIARYLVFPDYMEAAKQEIQELKIIIRDEARANKMLEEEKTNNKKELDIIKKENIEMKRQLQVHIDKSNLDNNIQKINMALSLYRKNKKEDAKKLIKEINTKGFSEEELKKYEYTKKKILR